VSLRCGTRCNTLKLRQDVAVVCRKRCTLPSQRLCSLASRGAEHQGKAVRKPRQILKHKPRVATTAGSHPHRTVPQVARPTIMAAAISGGGGGGGGGGDGEGGGSVERAKANVRMVVNMLQRFSLDPHDDAPQQAPLPSAPWLNAQLFAARASESAVRQRPPLFPGSASSLEALSIQVGRGAGRQRLVSAHTSAGAGRERATCA
jgi:hypothetical protein